MKTDTIAAIATAMSSSGIGIVRISGEEAEVYNTYIKAVEDGTLTFLSGGAEYEIADS